MCLRKLTAVFPRGFDDQGRAVIRVILANYEAGVHLEDIVQVTEGQTEHN